MVLTADKQILYCCTEKDLIAVTKFVLNAEAGRWELDRRLPSVGKYESYFPALHRWAAHSATPLLSEAGDWA